jgi:hypothetical protein
VLQAADVGSTIRAVVTATNASGSTPATSAATATIQAPVSGQTLGKTSIGAFKNTGGAGYLDTSGPYTLASSASVTKLTGYVQGGTSAQGMRAVIYADNGANRPGAFVAVSSEIIVVANAAPAWVDFPVSGAPNLPAGKYWLGYWYGGSAVQEYYDTVSGGGRYAPAAYAGVANPPASWPAGGAADSIGYSLYVTLGGGVAAPGNTALPTITGTATQGQTLTAGNGTWSGSPTSFADQWQRCDAAGNNCAAISGATASTYLLQGPDVGATIRVVVTATNAGGSTPATSAQTAVVQAAANAPSNTALPVVTGTTTQGSSLSTDNGTWTGSPTGFAYQWQRCDTSGLNCQAISGATSSSYLLVAGDVGSTIRSVVTATNASGSTPATSAATSTIQAQVSGQTLGKTTIGSFKNTGGASYLDSSGPYTLASSASVTKLTGYLQGGTSAQGMRAVIYADNGSNAPGAFVAVSSEVVIAANTPTAWVDFTIPSAPTLPAGKYWLGYWYGGSAVQEYYDPVSGGGRYAAAPYSSSADPPASFGTGTGDSIGYSLYASLGAPVGAPSNTAPPAITGTATQGQTLTVSNGTWSNSPTSFAYQWQRCDTSGNNCSAISGATNSTYVLVAGDVGSTMRAVVTATNAGGSTLATANQTATVVPLPPSNNTTPTITGTTTQGSTLTASNGTWSNSPTSFGYQWQRCDSAGSNCATISGATASTYLLVAADVGKTIRVVVTATNAGGSTPATSTQTGVVS